VLLEISGSKADGAAQAQMEDILTEATETGLIIDAAIAQTPNQARDLWTIRESISEAQRPEGGNIKHDISVAVARIPEFLERANAAVEKLCPGARPLPIGHFGDGNVHYNIAKPVGMEDKVFLAQWDTIMSAVHDVVTDMNGSISAEHGIGFMKRDELLRLKDPVELDLMRRIKTALDPKGLLNPGKVL
jgi:FAD/FMN-containing dehydrogenase